MINPFSQVTSAGRWLARKLLAVWVKTMVVPEPIHSLGLKSTQPVFYMLEDRSLSKLLVLEQACPQLGLPSATEPLWLGTLKLPRSVSAVHRWKGWLRRRPSQQSYSQTLLDLVTAARNSNQIDVQIVPVSIFWGRSPDKEHGWLKLLFADSWARVGYISQFFTILAHGRNTWLQFSHPLPLQAFLADNPTLTAERTVRKLCRVLRVHFRHQRSAAMGPDLSQRQALVNQLLRDQCLRQAIATEHEDKAIPLLRANERARRYAKEIAADFSYPFIVFMRRLLRRLWDRLYDGIEINHADTLQLIAPGHTVVYLPCHRSHFDYLLLSYVLHDQGLAIPHIAAGLNLNIPLIGPLLRRGGAFFLRRSFRGNQLYATVFHAYLSTILAKGFAIEYFIEGGRSRSGRSLAPKVGLLDMTVQAYLAHPQRPLVFVPVYIGYEKLVEGRSYLAELSGSLKQKESLLGFFKGLKALRSEFGKVHLNFGEPILLPAYLDQHQTDWQTYLNHEERPEWLRPVVSELGREIMTRINAAADINAINLLALALLSTPRRAMDEVELIQQIDTYRALLATAPYSAWLTVTPLDGRAIVKHGLALGAIQRQDHLLGPIINVTGDSAILLGYFRNNILHAFALPAIIACCFQNHSSLSLDRVIHYAHLVYPFIRSELFLHWSESELDTAISSMVEALVSQNLLERDNDGMLRRPAPGSLAEMRLGILAASVVNTFERFYITVTLLLKEGPHKIDQAGLEQQCQLMAQRLSLLYTLEAPEFYDKSLFRNFLATLQQMKLLHRDNDELLVFDNSLGARYREVWLLLSEQVRHSILQITQGVEFCAKPETSSLPSKAG